LGDLTRLVSSRFTDFVPGQCTANHASQPT
jgi:hypothetical protein